MITSSRIRSGKWELDFPFGIAGVVRDAHRVAARLQQLCHQRRVFHVVVNHQDARHALLLEFGIHAFMS